MAVEKVNPFFKKVAKAAYSLGEHNDPLNAVLAIALFKGINRPLFTMMDKKTDPQAKKYAAFREGLTEVIAATTYVGTNKLLVGPLSKILQKKTGGDIGKITHGLEFLCVCLSAVLLIPLACNIFLNPVMKGVEKFKKNKSQHNLDIKENVVSEITPKSQPVFKSEQVPNGPKSLLTVLQSKYPTNIGGNMKVGV